MLKVNDLETAIKVTKTEIMKLTHETLRPNQGYKIRMHGDQISGMVNAIRFYEDELEKLKVEALAATRAENAAKARAAKQAKKEE